MNKTRLALGALALALIVETLSLGYLVQVYKPATVKVQYAPTAMQMFEIPSYMFNTPISNDTEYNLTQSYSSSWMIVIQSQLTLVSHNQTESEAQIAIAPEYLSENLSIPTIIGQERADGLLRIEYYTQNWPKTYGLVLYNSTWPTWLNAQNVTLRHTHYGSPSSVNPQLAPMPNGNLTITVGGTIVLSNYPIAWATLSGFYEYGLFTSSFTSGALNIDVYHLQAK